MSGPLPPTKGMQGHTCVIVCVCVCVHMCVPGPTGEDPIYTSHPSSPLMLSPDIVSEIAA